MKAGLVVLIIALISGAVTVEPSRKWSLSLTPVRQERVSRQDARDLCPNITVRGAPRMCLQAAMERQIQQLDRSLKRLQRLQQRTR